MKGFPSLRSGLRRVQGAGCRFGKVGVLAGGPSNERDISLRSGEAVYNALLKEGVDAIFLDVSNNIYDIIKHIPIDVAFVTLHGRFGEDGTVQTILESAGIPYTGSGRAASRLAIDKAAAKETLRRNGIPVPDGITLEKEKFRIEDVGEIELPVVIKPQLEGSSIGLSVVKNKSLLDAAIKKAFDYGDKVILEEYIKGRELTVGILDDAGLPVIEIVTKERVYDYKAKYSDPETKYLVPAPISEELSAKARSLGERSHRALGCRCFSRVDMMLRDDGEIFVLEVNTIPGMTKRSLLPKAAQAAGFNFNKLCVKLLENAFKNEKAKTV